jgi:acyl-CoA thioester hydrolase
MQRAETTVRVRYQETDQMGVVYYANYLVWMEVARVDLCRELGFRYRDMEEETGTVLAVSEAKCRYRHPARYDDEVVIETCLGEVRSRGVQFTYRMRRADDNRLLADGETDHIFLNREGRPVRIPESYRHFFGQ